MFLEFCCHLKETSDGKKQQEFSDETEMDEFVTDSGVNDILPLITNCFKSLS